MNNQSCKMGGRKTSPSSHSLYRTRVKKSLCRRKSIKKCKKVRGCKKVSGKKRTYCRKKHSRRLQRGGEFDIEKCFTDCVMRKGVPSEGAFNVPKGVVTNCMDECDKQQSYYNKRKENRKKRE